MDKLLDVLIRKKISKRLGGKLKFFVSGGAALNPDIGRFFLSFSDRLFNKIPVLKTIFSGLTQLTKSFTNDDNSSKKMVLIEYPRKGIYSLGFATSVNTGEVSDKVGVKMINIFVPTTPNPTSGFLLVVPESDVVYLDMTFEDASKFIMSAGSIKK